MTFLNHQLSEFALKLQNFTINCLILFRFIRSLILALRLRDFYIDVGFNSDNSDGSAAKQCAYEMIPYSESETRVYTCPPQMVGRYVRIRFSENTREHLQLCEVQIQGTGKLLDYFIMQK